MIQTNATKFQIMRKLMSVLMVMFLLNFHINYTYAQGHNIHEYVHHLQIRTSNDDIRYNRLTRLKSYWENDYEVEARYIASKYSKKCLNDLKF